MANVEKLMAGDDLGMAILEAIDLKGFPARRIIVDCETGNAAMVYIEAFVSDKMLKLDWAEGLRGAEVKIVDKEGEDGTGKATGGS